jgi:transcriptional regulator of arginine metabolism
MKNSRQKRILEFIKKHDVETQDELLRMLKREGFSVTQATISRDIRELNLIKVQTPSGIQKYDVLRQLEDFNSGKFFNAFRDGVDRVEYTNNIVVIKTLPGMAMALALCVDGLGISDIIGSVAGDNTIFCAIRAEVEAASVAERINEIITKN